jgi:hypothetical protein
MAIYSGFLPIENGDFPIAMLNYQRVYGDYIPNYPLVIVTWQ